MAKSRMSRGWAKSIKSGTRGSKAVKANMRKFRMHRANALKLTYRAEKLSLAGKPYKAVANKARSEDRKGIDAAYKAGYIPKQLRFTPFK